MTIDGFGLRPLRPLQPYSPKVDFVVMSHHVVQRVVLLVLDPLALAGGLRYLVGGEAGCLSVGATMNQVQDISGFVQRNSRASKWSRPEYGSIVSSIGQIRI